jgi:hypothetical protein
MQQAVGGVQDGAQLMARIADAWALCPEGLRVIPLELASRVPPLVEGRCRAYVDEVGLLADHVGVPL